MFRCGICSLVSKPGERSARVVTETRDVVYPYRKGVNPIIKDGKREFRDDPGGKGWEIQKEILAHTACVPADAAN